MQPMGPVVYSGGSGCYEQILDAYQPVQSPYKTIDNVYAALDDGYAKPDAAAIAAMRDNHFNNASSYTMTPSLMRGTLPRRP